MTVSCRGTGCCSVVKLINRNVRKLGVQALPASENTFEEKFQIRSEIAKIDYFHASKVKLAKHNIYEEGQAAYEKVKRHRVVASSSSTYFKKITSIICTRVTDIS